MHLIQKNMTMSNRFEKIFLNSRGLKNNHVLNDRPACSMFVYFCIPFCQNRIVQYHTKPYMIF